MYAEALIAECTPKPYSSHVLFQLAPKPKNLIRASETLNLNSSLITTPLYYIRTYMHTYLHTFILSYIHTFIHTYVHTYMRVCIYIYTRMQTHLHAHVYIYIYPSASREKNPKSGHLLGRCRRQIMVRIRMTDHRPSPALSVSRPDRGRAFLGPIVPLK